MLDLIIEKHVNQFLTEAFRDNDIIRRDDQLKARDQVLKELNIKKKSGYDPNSFYFDSTTLVCGDQDVSQGWFVGKKTYKDLKADIEQEAKKRGILK